MHLPEKQSSIPQQQQQPKQQQQHYQQNSPVTENQSQKLYSMKSVSQSPTRATAATADSNVDNSNRNVDYDPNECTGCNQQVREGQALIALGRPWHSWCFKYIYYIKFFINSLLIYFIIVLDVKHVAAF